MKLNPVLQGILYCSLVAPAAALAQSEIEEIVVTGSLIRGTPEDAALPVEIHTTEEMRLSGAPTALEFAKTLTTQGPISGEAYYFGGITDTGNVAFNLRGLGADKTLPLLNGRRISGNTSIYPSAALERVEILKDGAAVTYGADATGGVVNFITREHYEGMEVDVSYKYIDGSDGDYSLSLLGGFGSDRTNVIYAAEWEHRSELSSTERRFSSRPHTVNPAPTSNVTNLTRWVAHSGGTLPDASAPGYDPRATSPLIPGQPIYVNTGEFGQHPLGGVVPDYTQESCEAVGGIYANGACDYNYAPFYNIVEDNDIYRIYGQINHSLDDKTDVHLRVAFSRVHTPGIEGSPLQPAIRGPAVNEGVFTQFYVPRTNPHFADFADRSGLSNHTEYQNGQIHGASALTYRAFAHGGNPYFADGDNASIPVEVDNKYWHVSTGVEGEFSNGVAYDFGVTYNRTTSWSDGPELIAYRLQDALNGFGGPNCNAVDQDPHRLGIQATPPGVADTGVRPDGCLWYNPFASNFVGQPILGLDNPSYGGPGALNSSELIDWMFDDRVREIVDTNITVDLIFSGLTPIELQGGNVAWGAGVQWRDRKRREDIGSPLANGSQPCPWPNEYGQVPLSPNDPNYNGCPPDAPGPFQFWATSVPETHTQDQKSAFAEFNFPVLENVYLTAAARYEEFSGGFDATVYKVSGKWDVTDNLSLRGSYGTNYQTPGITVKPGEVFNMVGNYSLPGGREWLGASQVTLDDLDPETAVAWNAGLVWQSAGFKDDHRFRVLVDYFNIETEDTLGLLATSTDIYEAVFAGGVTNCNHPLVHRVTFNGPCVQGSAPSFADIRTDFGNGPGQEVAGVDIQLNYGLPVYKGDLRMGLTATRMLTHKRSTATDWMTGTTAWVI